MTQSSAPWHRTPNQNQSAPRDIHEQTPSESDAYEHGRESGFEAGYDAARADGGYYRERHWQYQLEEAAARGADRAVGKTFAMLGVDVSRPEQVEEFREDLRLASRLRRAFDKGLVAGLAAVVALVGAVILLAVGKGAAFFED